MSAPDRQTLQWKIIHYRETFRELTRLRRRRGSRKIQRRLSAKLHRLSKAFSHDGGYSLADVLRDSVFRDRRK